MSLLQSTGITCVVDVRTMAASTYNPQYNKAPLTNYLRNNGIAYLHLAEEFGARHENPALHTANGQVDFKKVQQSAAFRAGVQRLEAGLARGFVIALMCSEADPLECHRFSMVARYLHDEGYLMQHILKDSSVLSTAELETELIKKYKKKIPQPSLFEPDVSRTTQLYAAYQYANDEIGWRPD